MVMYVEISRSAGGYMYDEKSNVAVMTHSNQSACRWAWRVLRALDTNHPGAAVYVKRWTTWEKLQIVDGRECVFVGFEPKFA